VTPKEGNGGQKSEKKLAKVHDSKGQKGSGKDPMTPEARDQLAGKPAEAGKLAGKPAEAPRPKQEGEAVGGLVQNLNGLVKSLTSVKSLFLKTVKQRNGVGDTYAPNNTGSRLVEGEVSTSSEKKLVTDERPGRVVG